MKKMLKKEKELYYIACGTKFLGIHESITCNKPVAVYGNITLLTGDVTNIYGDVSDLYGRISDRLFGDVTGITGDVTKVIGNLDECEIPNTRHFGSKINIKDLIND